MAKERNRAMRTTIIFPGETYASGQHMYMLAFVCIIRLFAGTLYICYVCMMALYLFIAEKLYSGNILFCTKQHHFDQRVKDLISLLAIPFW